MSDYRIIHRRAWDRRALKAEAALAKAQTWQPIETAPKEDGVPHVRGLWVHDSVTGERLYFDICAGYLQDGYFVSPSSDDINFVNSYGWRPEHYTHWMPLPEPPTEE